ncbi:MAG: methylated-DNA--[Bacteroidales bacterium]|nr:methylated-DNA--[protein]-cysteine S-methyltransferase [Bacteroidales bacterium]
MKTIDIQTYDSPCGTLLLGAFDARLCLCDWVNGWHRKTTERRLEKALNAVLAEKPSEVIEKARIQLDEYFRQERTSFDLPLLFVGTEFQRRVWDELFRIPYGSTISYGIMAQNLGMPKAVRAVANANGANAISIIAPCHRVIGSNGTLTGYGGGIEAKRFLLHLESQAKLPTLFPM